MAFGIYLNLQGVVTWCSDGIYIDRPSVWHPIDRAFAQVGALFVISSLVILMSDKTVRREHAGGLVAVLLGYLLSAALFAREWKLKQEEKIQQFILFHTGWHFFGSLGYFILLLSLTR